MGRKRVGTRKHFFRVAAILISFLLIGCVITEVKQQESEKMQLSIEPIHPAVVQAPQKKEQPRDESKEHLLKGKQLLAIGQYEASIREYLKVISIAPNGPPGDEANFAIGLIYAYSKYQKKDHGKAVSSLTRIVKEYPHSNWSGHAKILLDLIQENERLRRAFAEAGQENEKLKNMIEQSKKVDLEIEEKKREKAR
jgi:outer membrane protein assembly factor BamD (BamD/ComL family)